MASCKSLELPYPRGLHFSPFTVKPSFQPTCSRVAPLLAVKFLHLQQLRGHSIVRLRRLPPSAKSIHTPLRVAAWSSSLCHHPNQPWVASLLSGLHDGVRIGYTPVAPAQSTTANMQSAVEHPKVVESYLQDELESGNIAGPFSPAEVGDAIINRLGVRSLPNGKIRNPVLEESWNI